jgi:hypothetical protein
MHAILAIAQSMGRYAKRAVEAAFRGLRKRRAPRVKPAPVTADERTMRSFEEHRHGGLSSAESRARIESGENPGGLHHKRVMHEGSERQRPEYDEPLPRQDAVRRRHGEVHRNEMRRGR